MHGAGAVTRNGARGCRVAGARRSSAQTLPRLALRGVRLGLLAIVVGCDGDPAVELPAVSDAPVTPRVRGVMMISLDTLRADRLGFLGYDRGTSPNLDGVARRSVVFERARAQATQTAPSHASLLVSAYAGAHGIVNVHDGDLEAPVLPPDALSLAEVLAASGIRTAAFVSGGNFTRTMDMDRGFGVWNERNEDIAGRIDQFLRWLPTVGEHPFFAVVHSYQVHAPYVPPAAEAVRFTNPVYRGELRRTYERYLSLPTQEAWALGVGPDYWPPEMVDYTPEDVRFLSDLYDGEVAYLDGQLRRLFEAVLTGPRAADTALVVLSDHGEEFRDHGKFQHDQVFDELARVPLVVYTGGELERQGWKGRIESPVQLIDVAPTVADLLGVPWAECNWSGRSLAEHLDPVRRARLGRADGAPVFIELSREHRTHVYSAVVWQGWKYIVHRQTTNRKTWEHLFNLEVDSGEQDNLMDSKDAAATRMLEALRGLLSSFEEENALRAAELGRAEPSTLSEEQIQELKRLGYTGTPR
jgi:arylsulfatase A-like enzyme